MIIPKSVMKNLTYIFIFILLSSISSYGNNGRYRIIITDDPSSTITIGWEQQSGTNPTIHYGTTDFGTAHTSYPNSKTVDRTSNYKGMNNTFAKLTGLTPDTNYYFVINDSQGISARFWFKTAPNTNIPMSFISGGDSRNNRGPRQNANTMVSKIKPTAVFFGGDMTDGDSDTEWQNWMDDWQLTTSSDGRMIPIIPARGNHESSNSSITELFDVPSSDAYYEITFGANLYTIYTLNSEITEGGTQATWLQNSLQNNTSIWKSAQYHKPIRPHQSGKSEGNNEYNAWAQLFENHQVKLVFESDSHVVKTTWPIVPCTSGSGCEEGFVRDDVNGTVYVGEGCWGAPIRAADDTKVWTRNSGSFNQFKFLCVSPTEIRLKTIDVNNASSVEENPNSIKCLLPPNTQVWGDEVVIGATPNALPIASITQPSDNAVLVSGASTDINVSSSDSDGTITNVEFYVNGALIGSDNTAPYTYSYNFPDGQNAIRVVTYDNDLATGQDYINIAVGSYSDSVSVTVSNDVEEGAGDGNIYSSSSDLELVYDSYNSQGYQTIGLRFASINIPQGATIDNAYIQFTADESHSDNCEFIISIENENNAANYDESDNFNASSRNRLASTVNWSPAAWTTGDSGADERTPSLSALVEAVIGRSGWNSGNALSFIIEGTGVSLTNENAKRVAEAIEGTAAAKLVIDYTVTAPTLSISKPKETDPLFVYPNPAYTSFNISGLKSVSQITLFDITGKKALVKKNYKEGPINISNLPNALYFVYIQDSQGNLLAKIITLLKSNTTP